MPKLATLDTQTLNAPLTEEELLTTLAQAHNGRAPGADGLPAEVYKRYSSQLIPVLLKVYNAALNPGRLPLSMNEAIIGILLKPGKDALT